MEKTRVDELIDILLYTTNSLGYACEQIGCSEYDLTEEEMVTLYENIFQCGRCGYWHDTCEENFDFTYGSVCDECDIAEQEDEIEE